MKNKLTALVLGLVAAALYFLSQATCVFPGDSARLIALMRGLDTAKVMPYPLTATFAKLFGGGNLLAPVSGVIAVVCLYLLVSSLTRLLARASHPASAGLISRVAGVATAIVFMLTPSVRSAASHLEPRLFDLAWALVSFALVLPCFGGFKAGCYLYPIIAGVMAGVGCLDSAIFLAFMPFYLVLVTLAAIAAKKKPYVPLTLFVIAFVTCFLVSMSGLQTDLMTSLKNLSKELKGYVSVKGWIFVLLFTTIPFVAVLFSSAKAFRDKPTLVTWLYHGGMTVVAILAVATPLAPSALMRTHGILPVAASAFAAILAGHLVAFWWTNRRQVIGLVGGGVLTVLLAIVCLWNLFAFDRAHGSFADEIAQKILADLGTRTWLITDGSIDDHILIAAAQKGQEVNLVSLARDMDSDYLEKLTERVREKKLGGEKCEDLALSLTLGVLPFVQDWLAGDPDVAKQVAIYGAPDLWYAAGHHPVPEFLFFGADDSRVPDEAAWKEFDKKLFVEKGWGSYRSEISDDPVQRLKAGLRRHVGFVMNNRGVYLQDHKQDDAAFALYERVLNEVDPDNICALFNEVEMAGAKHPKALAKQRDLEKETRKVVEDKNRRYYIWRLGTYYGYIRNPDMFIRLGYSWARSGRPGEALTQLRRAIDYVPKEKRAALLNMMAALYTSESDRAKSRDIYQSILAKDRNNHDALIGLMRLELMEGNTAKAIEYMRQAAAVSADGYQGRIEHAMLALLDNQLPQARELLEKATKENPKDLQGWSLLAGVMMQQFDSLKDKKEQAAILKRIETIILPSMAKQSTDPFDYYIQTTKAFLLLRKGDSHRKEARDALATAVKARPSASMTQDMMLNLDISLNDPAEAEAHAREILRQDRESPLANYVMGSIAIGKEEYRKAEVFLRKATDCRQPVLLALNDMAEVLRRLKRLEEAEKYARRAVQMQPEFYTAWDTLGAILLEGNKKLDEAESCVQKACELSKGADGSEQDIRVYMTLARIQLAKGDKTRAHKTLMKVQGRVKDLSAFELKELEELKQRAR